MKLKKLLATLEGLDPSFHALYTKRDDGKFHLELEDDDAEPLRRAKEHEVGLRQIAERDLAAANEQLAAVKAENEKLKTDAGKSVNEVRETLAAEYAAKEAKLIDTHTKQTEALQATVKKVFVDDVAFRIANELSDAPDLMLPFIQQRLQVEIVDGKPVTRVIGPDGKPSIATPDELKAEYSQDKRFERILRGSNASGGGAQGGFGGGGAPKKLADMNEKERMEFHQRDPAGFQKAVEQLRQSGA